MSATTSPPMPAGPLAARVVAHALGHLPVPMRAAVLAGRGNDRRIRRALAELHAAGVIPSISRRDMTAGAAYLAHLEPATHHKGTTR